MSSHFCDICGLSEYEYTGSRAEYSNTLSLILGEGCSSLCGDCRMKFMNKLNKVKLNIIDEIKKENKDYWETLDKGINR